MVECWGVESVRCHPAHPGTSICLSGWLYIEPVRSPNVPSVPYTPGWGGGGGGEVWGGNVEGMEGWGYSSFYEQVPTALAFN